jgi:hypothetical protein
MNEFDFEEANVPSLEDAMLSVREMLVSLSSTAAGEELLKLTARINKKTFDALVAEGFTQDQAVQIVAAQGSSNIFK